MDVNDSVLVRVANEVVGNLSTWSPPHRVMIAPDPADGATHQMYFQTYAPDGATSDGFHTFNELYRHRMLLTAALFREWYMSDIDPAGPLDGEELFKPHKSHLHSDGGVPFGGGWFIVVAQLPTGQISYHYPWSEENWELFKIPSRERAAQFDGHTSEQAAQRLEDYLRSL